MNRLILALMALFAGLTAPVAPAAARVSEGTEIGASAHARLAERQAAALAAVADALTAPPSETAAMRREMPQEPQVAALAAVLTGIDRARE